MRAFLNLVNLVVVCAVALAMGLRRVMLEPDEVYFFSHVGLGETIVVIFGLGQLIAVALVMVPKTRVRGALASTAFFAAGTGIYLMTEQIVFGLVSCIPLLMAGWIAHETVQVDDEDA